MAETPQSDGYYKVYEEYSKTLRTWFVAYGIGAPVLVLNSDNLRAALVASGGARTTALLFLAGVGLQVLLATVNKTVAWVIYAELESPLAAEDSKPSTRWRFKVADAISEQFWIDFVVDIATGVVFVLGSLRIFSIAAGTG
jgi:hypothetical protein